MNRIAIAGLGLVVAILCLLGGVFLGSRYGSPTATEPTPIVAAKETPVPVGETTERGQEQATNSPPVESTTSEEAPNFFYGDDCPPEENPGGCSFDVGINPSQIGLAFGWHIKWPQAGLDAGGDGCDLVILNPGWYENLWFLDARIEVYDVPERDREGWIEVLAIQRAEEQMFNYDCIGKDLGDIPVWDSSRPSPPVAESESSSALAPEPTATPTLAAEPTATLVPAVECTRRETGQNQTIHFEKGDSVYGWKIQLDDGRPPCDDGECYLPVAPGPGEVTSGVICPWASEVEGITPWDPN